MIIARAKDEEAQPRSILHCFPHPKLKMRVVELDEQEGTFLLETVDASKVT